MSADAGAAVVMRDVFRIHRTPEGDAAALQGLSLRVRAGETVVVVGPSGAGKSSLLRAIAGLQAPSAGSVRVLGHELTHLSERRRAAFRQRAVGLVDQHSDRALPAALSCRDLVALPLALRGQPREQRRARAHELLERVGLADRLDARPHELSGGERQRVAVCAAVAHRPGLLLADEPGGELDAASAQAVYAVIADLARHDGTTVVLVSHDLAATAIADRSVRLRDGRISGETLAGEEDEAIVVDRGGWLRVPETLLRATGVGRRVRARAVASGPDATIELRAVGATGAGEAGPVGDEPGSPGATDADAVAGPPAAELRGVSKAYADGAATRVVLDDRDLAVAPARLTVVSGRSGSGKSTILRLLAGLEPPDRGEVVVGGRSLAGLGRDALAQLRRERVALVAQDVGLVGFLSARENVALGLVVRGSEQRDADALAQAWLERVGLGERASQRVQRLSAGERQRVALARAMIARPALLLVDEPTSRLDEANAAAVARLLGEIVAAHGTAVVCATHDPQLVARADVEIGL
jgi:ABC-type lipoprotein export system ATPase subunit